MTRRRLIWPVQRCLLLAVSSVGHRHPLLTALSLHGWDVEDKVGVEDSLAGVLTAHHPTVLAECVADPADVQVVFWHLHLPTHCECFAGILTVGVAAVRLEKYLVLLTFPANIIPSTSFRKIFNQKCQYLPREGSGRCFSVVTYLDEFCSPSFWPWVLGPNRWLRRGGQSGGWDWTAPC